MPAAEFCSLRVVRERDEMLSVRQDITQPIDLNGFKLVRDLLGDAVQGRDASRPYFDLIITASYGKIIPKEMLDFPKYGALNVHPSLLPKYRGSSPVQYAILNGDKETGATIMLMDEKMDHGKILAQEKIRIEDRQTFLSLHNELAQISAELLVKTIPLWINNEIKPCPQDCAKATYAKIITKKDGKINWNKSAEEIECQIRAFSLWPGCWTILNIDGEEKCLKIIDAAAETKHYPARADWQAGKIIKTENKKMTVVCGSGILKILQLQIEGKKIMAGENFLNGHQKLIGQILK